MYENVWDSAKVVLREREKKNKNRRKCIVLNVRKGESLKINDVIVPSQEARKRRGNQT